MRSRTPLGELLLASLRDHNMKQYELARRVGAKPETVSAWMRGKWAPSDQKLEDVAKVLELDVEELRTRAGQSSQNLPPQAGNPAVGRPPGPEGAILEALVAALQPVVESLQTAAPDLMGALNQARRVLEGHSPDE